MQELQKQSPKGRANVWKWIAIAAAIFIFGAVICVQLVINRAQPILQTRVIETLSNHFNSKVELAGFQVSIIKGIEVSGDGLKIYGKTDPNPYEPGVQPLIGIREFRFRTSLTSLFRTPMHVETVYLKGLELNIPPKGDRQQMTKM